MIKQKTELEKTEELLQSALIDLTQYRKFAGQSPVIDANIRHKEQQVRELDAKVRRLRDEAIQRDGLQMNMFGGGRY